MKRPTFLPLVRSAFSLVELLVVIMVIAIIAAVAIPNIAGVLNNATTASDRRNAQHVASIAAAAIGAGATNLGSTVAEVASNLGGGVYVTNGVIVNGPFRLDGLNGTNYEAYLTATNGSVMYHQ
jgi:prepilin-type N-terminal cleavage/methylation domain-containing protein